jgi:DNA-binding response OmpR family regulator
VCRYRRQTGSRAAATRWHACFPTCCCPDLGLPDSFGIELIRVTESLERRVLPIVITVFGDERHVVAALEAGALPYLLQGHAG